jgi:hypothetical protein
MRIPLAPWASRLRVLLAALTAGLACAGGEDNTGVGGVLIVSQVEVDGGNRLVLIGGTLQLQATPRTSTGIPVPGKTVAWSSSNNGIAPISDTGLLTGVAPGTVTVTARVDGVSGSVNVEVRPVPVAAVEVTTGAATIEAGQTTTAQAVARDSVGGLLTGRPVSWSSSNPSVATVSPAGVVTGMAAGSASIIATIEGRTGSATLAVTARPATRLGFVTQPSPAVAGQPMTPPVQVAFQDGVGGTAVSATGTITLSFSSNPTGATLGGTLSAQAVNGVATFPGLTVNRAGGPYSLQANSPGFPAATSSTFAVTAGAAAALAISSPPAGAAASGDPLGQQPVIQLQDALGNNSAQAGVPVTASVASGPGVLAGTTTVPTDANGRAVFTNLAILGAVGTYTLRFESPGLVPAVSGPIGLGAGNPTQVTFTVAPPATATNGVALPGAITVQLRDGTGNPVAQAGVVVTASRTSGPGILSGTTTVPTGSNGAATFTGLTLTGAVGSYVLSFSAAGLSPAVSNPIQLGPGPETALSFVTAPPATAVNGTPFTVTPVVQLRDFTGNPVARSGVAVTVSAQSVASGTLTGVTARLTDAQGRAEFPGLGLLGQAGSYTLSFRSGSLAEAISNPIVLGPGPATALAFATAPPLGTASGVALTPAPVVQVVDQSGNAVALGSVTITAALASGSGALSGTLTVPTGAQGAATFANLVLTGPAGPHTIRFSAAGLGTLTSGTITVGAGAPTQLTFSVAPPATATNGAVISPAVVVQLRDGVGNPAAISGVAVTVTRTSGSAALGGTLTVATGSGGSATFSDLTLTGLVGNQVLTFSATGLTPAVSNAIALQAGPATQLTFTTAPPASAVNGIDLAPAIVVQLRDLSGNPVASAGVGVTATIVTGAGGVLSGTNPVSTAANGTATFSNLRITGTVGQYTLRFSAMGVSAATANPLTLQPGAATALAMSTQPPPSAISGVPLSPQPAVRVVDQSGNTVTSSTASITASLESGPGTLGGTLTVSAVGGIATWTNLAITGTTGSYTIRFASAGLTPVISGSIGLGAGAATALQFVGTPPTSATNGSPIAPAIAVRLVDASANPVTQSGVSVGAVLASGPGVLGGTVVTTTDGNGVATFNNLVLTGTVGTYTIRFEVSGITPVTTPAISLAAGAAARLGFATAPSGAAQNGVALTTQPVVEVQDASGNPVAQSGVVISASRIAGPALDSLTGRTATTGSTGQAVFTALRITGLVGTYTLEFTGGGYTPVQANVTVSAGAPVAVQLVQQPGANATNGVAFATQPWARLVDLSGNNAGSTGTPVTASLGQTPGPASLGGTTTVNLGSPDQQARFTNLAITGTTGNYTLVFSSPGMTPAESNPIALAPSAATQLLFTTSPPTTATNGAILGPAIGVRLGDLSGNPVPSAGVQIAAAIASGSGAVLGGTVSRLTDANGQTSFADLTLTGTVGSFTLTFTSSGLSPATTGTITLTAGPAASLAFTTPPPLTGINGQILTPATVVQLRDQSDNVVSTTGTPITAEIAAGSGGTLSGTLTRTTTSGSSSFGDLVITGPAGNYTLRFTSSGLTSVSAPAPLALAPGGVSQMAFAVSPPANATSGTALTPQPEIQLQDQSGNPVAASGVTITATASGGATLANASAVTNSSGRAVFSGLSITGSTGNYTLTFASAGLPDLASGAIALAAGSASQLAFVTALPATATNGSLLSPQPVVELRDASGNPVLTAGVSVTASLASGPGSLLGTLTATTGANGRATFSNLELRGLPGSYVVRFTSGALPPLDSEAIALAVGPASQLLFEQAPPASAVNGVTFSSSTVVKLADAAGNTVTTSGVSVAAAVASGPGATLGGTTPRTTAAGLATFDDLRLTGTAGSYTLDFTSAGLSKATSGTITLAPGPATKLVFAVTTPAAAQSGAPFSPAPVVQLQDASSNNVAQAGVVVTADRFSGDASVVVSGGSVATDGLGRATFSSLTLTGPVGNYVLGFASAPLTGLLSPPIALSAGGAAKLGFVTAPSTTATNGQPLAQQPVVQLLDAANNPVAEAGRAITIGLTGGGTLTAASLTVLTNASGQAAFTDVTITGLVGGSRTLEFSGASLSTLSSAPITLAAGPASALAMQVQPSATATSGSPLAQQPVVQVVDISGNAVADQGRSVTVSLVGSGATLTASSLTVATSASGQAAFAGVTLTGNAGSYSLAFAAAPLTGVTSSAIDLSAATATTIAANSPTTQSATAGTAVTDPPSVLVTGTGGVPVPGVEVTFTVSGGGSIVPAAPAVVLSGSNGVAALTSWTLGTVAGTNTVTATATGLAGSPITFTATGTAGAATQLAITTQPGGATDAQAFSIQPVVEIQDTHGNRTTSTASVAAAVSSGSGTLAGTTPVAAVAGVATFTDLRLHGLGPHRLTFSSAGLTSAVSAEFSVAAGVVASVTVSLAQPSVTGNATQTATAEVRDAGGNLLSSPVSWSVSDSQRARITAAGFLQALGQGTATVTASSGGKTGSATLTIGATAGAYAIDLVYLGSVSPAVDTAFVTAAGRWATIIRGDLPDVTVTDLDVAFCGNQPSGTTFTGTIDDLRIYVKVDSIDGVGGVLGSAGPCWIRGGSGGLPFIGAVRLDAADVADLETQGLLDPVVRHEIGHVLGIGTVWETAALLVNPSPTADPAACLLEDPRFVGVNGQWAFATLGTGYGGLPVPVENCYGSGTRNAHWRESVLARELMTGFVSPTLNPLSPLTVTSLLDLGYVVDNSAADPLPWFLLAPGQPRRQIIELPPPPPRVFGARGGRS